MISVCYISQSQIGGDIGVLIDIWEISQRNNRRREVTGGLYCDETMFLQVLEGPPSAVHRAMRRIFADPRHAEIQIIHGSEIQQRRFEDWDMKVVNAMSDYAMAERFQRDRIVNGGLRYIDARVSEILAA